MNIATVFCIVIGLGAIVFSPTVGSLLFTLIMLANWWCMMSARRAKKLAALSASAPAAMIK